MSDGDIRLVSNVGPVRASRTGRRLELTRDVDENWMRVPSIFRIRLTGTGSVRIDSRDSLGNVTSGIGEYSISNATDQIEYPYAGNAAVEIRAVTTGAVGVEVI